MIKKRSLRSHAPTNAPPFARAHGMVFAALLGAGLASPTGARAAEDRGEGTDPSKTLQVMADLTLIDGSCRNLVVNFGVAFRFAAAQGLTVTAILPTGSQRDEFERVLQARQTSLGGEELCGQVAANYADALPGSITGLSGRTPSKR